MKQIMHGLAFFLAYVLVLILSSCIGSEPVEVKHITAPLPSEPSPTATLTVTAIVTPTQTANLTQQPGETSTSTPKPTAPQTATATPMTSPTITLTIPPINLAGTNLEDLVEEGYEQIENALIITEDGSYYLAYTLQDSHLIPFDVDWTTGPEVCRVAFFRWQNEEVAFWGSLPAPIYPQSDNEEYPFACHLINWEQSFTIDPFLAYAPLWPTFISEKPKEILNMQAASSDINNNGLPEFAVAYQYCNNACWNWGIVATHFYEIQADGIVIDITANLPGTIVPFFNIVHDNQPGTLYVYDRGYVGPGSTVSTWWIYAWNGNEYEDITSQYADNILEWGNNRLAEIRQEYGNSLGWLRYDFGEILLQYDKAGLRDEAIGIITEITDLSHWPDTDEYYLCYLHLIRETALVEYQNDKTFSLPPGIVGFGGFELPVECDNLTTK